MTTWTVVRFPNGSWSYGGKPTDPDYAECEVFRIPAESAKKAVKAAQSKRSAALSKTKRLAAAQAAPEPEPEPAPIA